MTDSLKKSHFLSDTLWALMSLPIQALMGGVLNFSLMDIAGPYQLGIFNQVYAVFVIMGQFGAIGINDSLQRHLSRIVDNKSEVVCSTRAALVAASLSSLAVCVVTALGIIVVNYFNVIAADLASALLMMVPGLYLFVLNKVLLAGLNGRLKIKAYSLILSTRAIILVIMCIMIAVGRYKTSLIGAAFSLTELVVFVLLAITNKEYLLVTNNIEPNRLKHWINKHRQFGILALPQGLLSETMVRVDVVMLTLFFNSDKVGVYSFVAFFIEGILQIPYLTRTAANPRLANLLMKQDKTQLKKVMIIAALASGVSTLMVAGLLWSLFPQFILYFPKTDPEMSIKLIRILLPAMLAYSFLAPTEQMLLQSGRPGRQSLIMIIVAATNIVLNAILIPIYGLSGAAMSTALAYICSGLLFFSNSFAIYRTLVPNESAYD